MHLTLTVEKGAELPGADAGQEKFQDGRRHSCGQDVLQMSSKLALLFKNSAYFAHSVACLTSFTTD